MSLLSGKTVVVSGVGAGLGHQVAAAVVRDGGNAVLGARTEANLAKSAAEIDPDGAHTAYRSTDITDEQQCVALAELALERFGRLDALVQVAAWDSYFGGLEDADFATWQSVVDVNLLGWCSSCTSWSASSSPSTTRPACDHRGPALHGHGEREGGGAVRAAVGGAVDWSGPSCCSSPCGCRRCWSRRRSRTAPTPTAR
ncbi:SDR family NAD(P)-dependent oxidoreductase [Streptomyces shaanxiensis]